MQTKPIGTPTTNRAEPPRNAELYRACQQFESLFVLQLWRAMQRTIPNQPKTLNYAEMFDLHFAEHLAQNGRFGLAYQLYRRLESASPQEPASTPDPSHPDEGGSR